MKITISNFTTENDEILDLILYANEVLNITFYFFESFLYPWSSF